MQVKTRFTVLSLCVIVALLVGAWQPVLAQESPPTPAPVGLRPDAPEYAVHGPYWVGYKPVVIGEGTDHPLNASLWYPALNPNGDPEEIVYPMTWKMPSMPLDAEPLAYGHALLDAPVDKSGAPYPLVVFSPGLLANPPWNANLLEHYASYGFIVLSPDHVEEFDWELSNLWKSFIDRPNDIKQTLDYAEQATVPDGDLAGLVDMQHVAVAGHSAGGYTTLAAAGAQYDLEAFNARCAALPPDDPARIWMCGPLVPHETDMADRAGLDPMPEGLWPSFGDPRVTAIIPMASDSYLFDQAGLAKITVPMMAIGGTADTGTPYDWGIGPAYEYASSAKKALVALEGAEHGVACASCETLRFIRDTPFSPYFCYDPVWDKDRAHDIMNHFATAFLLAELKGDAAAAAALAPENVSFPGIEYQAEGYAPANAEAGLDAETEGKIDAVVEQVLAGKQVPGAALAIVKDGAVIYAKDFGLSDLESEQPMTPDSVFFLASVAKSFTGMAIMQLVEEGEIDPDAPVTDYLPDFALDDPAATAITIRQLLSHSSGMADYGDWMADITDADQRTDDAVLADYVHSFGDGTLLFPPGTAWSYSNSGFDTLGAVVAAVSGQTFEEYVQEHILTPLGMTNSTFLLGDVDPAVLVAPHTWDQDGQTVKQEFYPYSRKHGPSAALFSSVNDMVRFANANMNHGELDGVHVLPATAYEEMWAPQAASTWVEMFGPQVSDYGLGWWVGTFKDHTIIGNYGAEAGFQSHLGIFPDDGFAVIALVNAYDPAGITLAAYDIGNVVAEVLLGIEPEAETAGSD